MNVAELVARARERLRAGGVPADEAPGDAEVLARHALGWDLTRYAVECRETPPADFAGRYEAMIARRLAREPVSQILGRREFWGLDFEVTRDVLTPRPETELAVEAVLEICGPARAAGRAPIIVDVGTGSGCIAVALAKELPEAMFIASDASLAALAVARRNAARHGVAGRIAFLHSSLIPPEQDVDIIVSNPPYIPKSAGHSLPVEVREYEPHLALFGGEDGLAFHRRLLTDTIGNLQQGGWLVLEVGYDQAGAVRALAEPHDWETGPTYRDLQGFERVLTFRARRRYSGEPDDPSEDGE